MGGQQGLPPNPHRHRSPESWRRAASGAGDLQPAWSVLTETQGSGKHTLGLRAAFSSLTLGGPQGLRHILPSDVWRRAWGCGLVLRKQKICLQEAVRGASHADLSFQDVETCPAGMPCGFAGLGLASGLRPCSHSLATANQSLSYGLHWVSRQNSEKPSNIMYRGLSTGGGKVVTQVTCESALKRAGAPGISVAPAGSWGQRELRTFH